MRGVGILPRRDFVHHLFARSSESTVTSGVEISAQVTALRPRRDEAAGRDGIGAMVQAFEAALLRAPDGETAAAFAGPVIDDATVTFVTVLNDALAVGTQRLVIDLRHISEVGEPAVAALSAAARRADARDIDVVIREPCDEVRDSIVALEPDLFGAA